MKKLRQPKHPGTISVHAAAEPAAQQAGGEYGTRSAINDGWAVGRSSSLDRNGSALVATYELTYLVPHDTATRTAHIPDPTT